MTKLILVLSLCGVSFAQVAMSGVQPASDASMLEKEAPSSTAPSNAQDLLPELPPPPAGDPTLIGGTILTLDQVRNQIVLRIFGGDDMKVLFDERTRIVHDGVKSSFRDLKAGERVYVDTVLDGKNVFARGIRIQSRGVSGEGHGQVMAIDHGKNQLLLRDQLSPEPVRIQLTSSTRILNIEKKPAAAADIRTGALVTVKFRPDGNGSGTAQEVSILALPGTAFTFVGRVTFLDLHAGLLVLEDPRDKKNYEIHFDPSRIRVGHDVKEGADVSVTADFDGSRYTARAITGISPSASTQPAESTDVQR